MIGIKRFSDGKPIKFNNAKPSLGGNEYADGLELTHSNESESGEHITLTKM